MSAIAYRCPRCGSEDFAVLGALRGAVYQCRRCGHQFQATNRKDV
jgi:DNA-directed RNA polymerase subunit RPC12/RpoP